VHFTFNEEVAESSIGTPYTTNASYLIWLAGIYPCLYSVPLSFGHHVIDQVLLSTDDLVSLHQSQLLRNVEHMPLDLRIREHFVDQEQSQTNPRLCGSTNANV
jgi:hypothetical protein